MPSPPPFHQKISFMFHPAPTLITYHILAKSISNNLYTNFLPKTVLVLHIFSFIITIYLNNFIGIKSFNTNQCPSELSPWIIPPCILYLTKYVTPTLIVPVAPSRYNHPIQDLFIAAVIAVLSLFLSSCYMYAYITLVLINQCVLNIIFSMAKALNGQNSSKQNLQDPSRTFKAIGKTLLKLLSVFLFFSSLLFVSNFLNFFWLHSSCDFLVF